MSAAAGPGEAARSEPVPPDGSDGAGAKRIHGDLVDRTDAVLAAEPVDVGHGRALGRSRAGRSVVGFRFGRGGRRVSLIAGCHADEPVGPILLRRLAGHLSRLPPEDRLLRDLSWWLVPHANPDGEVANRRWSEVPARGDAGFDLARYLAFAVRELPGDDVEFCFPADEGDDGGRPENRAIRDWWTGAGGPFSFHASLHGMAIGAGPWFLIEPSWRPRSSWLRRRLAETVRGRGHELHDVERRGEKGFVRIEPGFCTRPDSHAMKAHFVAGGDPDTADRFRPSSMETVRSLGGDPLTLVSEIPLFRTPGVGEKLGPPDPAAERWRERIAGWRAALRGHGRRERPAEAMDEEVAARVREEAAEAGLASLPIEEQLRLQWAMVAAGLAQASGWTRAAPFGGSRAEATGRRSGSGSRA